MTAVISLLIVIAVVVLTAALGKRFDNNSVREEYERLLKEDYNNCVAAYSIDVTNDKEDDLIVIERSELDDRCMQIYVISHNKDGKIRTVYTQTGMETNGSGFMMWYIYQKDGQNFLAHRQFVQMYDSFEVIEIANNCFPAGRQEEFYTETFLGSRIDSGFLLHI